LDFFLVGQESCLNDTSQVIVNFEEKAYYILLSMERKVGIELPRDVKILIIYFLCRPDHIRTKISNRLSSTFLNFDSLNLISTD